MNFVQKFRQSTILKKSSNKFVQKFQLHFILLWLCVHCAGTGLVGMRQRDLIHWYVRQQNEKNSYTSAEEASAEITKVKAIIEVKPYIRTICLVFDIFLELKIMCLDPCLQSLIRREGHLIVVDEGRQAAEDSQHATKTSRNDRILAVAPNYVVD